MRLASLTNNMMINTTEDWISTPEIRDQLNALGPLGAGLLAEVEQANTLLVEQSMRRRQMRARLLTLVRLCQQLDEVHDDKARALFFGLDGLIYAQSDPARRLSLSELKARLFPIGLQVVRLPYVEEGGAARQLEEDIGADLRAQLAALPFGEQTLEQVYDDWIMAGRKLGRAANQRARAEASMRTRGSAVEQVDLRHGRNRWMQAVRGLLWALETKQELQPLVEPIESALRNAIAIADRRRLARRTAADPGEALAPEAGEPLDTDEEGPLLDEEAQEQLLAQIEQELAVEQELAAEQAEDETSTEDEARDV